MYHTAWTSKSSSVPSDRIKPSRPSSSQSNTNTNTYSNTNTSTSTNTKSQGKGKGKGPGPQEPLKSREVRRLEALLSALSDSDSYSTQPVKKDLKGGCFCQARDHSLSPYTPICRTCGLILCEVNQPNYACPHCAVSLIDGQQRDALVARLQRELDEVVTKEIVARERAIEEARLLAGAFPTLGGTTGPGPGAGASAGVAVAAPRPQVPQTRKVLSVNLKTKKVMVSSYTSTPATSRPASRSEAENQEAEEKVVRVPPPADVGYAEGIADPGNPWVNLRDGDWRLVYVAPVGTEQRRVKGKGRGGGKGKE